MDFDDYCHPDRIVKPLPVSARPLHELAVTFRDTLFGNPALYDLMFNSGEELPPESRATSYFSLPIPTPDRHRTINLIWEREEALIRLRRIEEVIGLAKKEQIALPTRHIVVPGSPSEERTYEPGLLLHPFDYEYPPAVTQDGLPLEVMDKLHARWASDSDSLATHVVRYRSLLENAVDEFNLELMLGMMQQCAEEYVPGLSMDYDGVSEHDVEVEALRMMVHEDMGPKSMQVLCKAYKKSGLSFMREASRVRDVLDSSDFGKAFVVQELDLDRQMKKIYDAVSELCDYCLGIESAIRNAAKSQPGKKN